MPPPPSQLQAQPKPAKHPPGIDEHTLTRKFQQHRSELRTYASRMLNHSHNVDDILQDSLLQLWKNRHSFQPGSNFRAWAYRTVYFKSLSYIRDNQRDPSTSFSPETIQHISERRQSHHENDADPRYQALQDCITRLRPEEQELVEKKYHHHLKLSEIARLAAIPANTIHKAISRIRQTLRQCIQNTLAS